MKSTMNLKVSSDLGDVYLNVVDEKSDGMFDVTGNMDFDMVEAWGKALIMIAEQARKTSVNVQHN